MEQIPWQAQEAHKLWFRFNTSLQGVFSCWNFRAPRHSHLDSPPYMGADRTPQENGQDRRAKGWALPFQAPGPAEKEPVPHSA